MTMDPRPDERRLNHAWWALILVVLIVGAVVLSTLLYVGVFKSRIPVTVTSDRAGLSMQTDSKVMLNGVQVGTVVGLGRGQEPTSIKLEIDADQAKYIPANVSAQIRSTTVFGAKYVDLIYPKNPTKQRLSAGAVVKSKNVTTEINTVLESLRGLVDQIDPMKINAVLTALSQGVRGKGERIGQAITDANQVLLALNPRSDVVRQDWQALKGFSDVYAGAADNLVSILDATATTSKTITSRSAALDALLLNTVGLSQSGLNLLAPNQQNLVDAVNTLEPTTALLLEHSPAVTCTLVGVKWWLDHGGYHDIGGNGYSEIADAGILLGDEPYKYPDNLPIIAAKGGPGGKPGCGSLPDPSKMYPVRALVTNTGWGTGIDYRPNPRSRGKLLARLPAGHPSDSAAPEHPEVHARSRAGAGQRTRPAAVRRIALWSGRRVAVARHPGRGDTASGARPRYPGRPGQDPARTSATGVLRSAAAGRAPGSGHDRTGTDPVTAPNAKELMT